MLLNILQCYYSRIFNCIVSAIVSVVCLFRVTTETFLHALQPHSVTKLCTPSYSHLSAQQNERPWVALRPLTNWKMLAPRKTLWSTPDAVIEKIIEWVPLSSTDKVCDIGCGDGRVLLTWAICLSNIPTVNISFVGIDIDEMRISQANDKLNQARVEGRIDSRISISFHCANALEATHLFQDATVIFLYLIPRGLRKMKSLIRDSKRPVRVVTYMAPLPDETPLRQEMITVPHQPGATWPLYLYQLNVSEDG